MRTPAAASRVRLPSPSAFCILSSDRSAPVWFIYGTYISLISAPNTAETTASRWFATGADTTRRTLAYCWQLLVRNKAREIRRFIYIYVYDIHECMINASSELSLQAGTPWGWGGESGGGRCGPAAFDDVSAPG